MVKEIYRGFGRNKFFRKPQNVVNQDLLRLNLQVGGKTKTHLQKMPDQQYSSLFKRLESFQNAQTFSNLLIDPPKKLKGFDFSVFQDAFLLTRITGVTLDLTDLEINFARFVEDRAMMSVEAARPTAVFPPDMRPPIFPARAQVFDVDTVDPARERMVPYHIGSRFYRFGANTVEYTGGKHGVPSKVFSPQDVWNAVKNDGNEIVEAIYGERLPEEEAFDHFRQIDYSYTVRLPDGTPIAKAMAEQITGYRDKKGKVGIYIYYTGILAKKEYRRGIIVSLTFDLMLQIFRGLGAFRLIFKKTPVAFRTQDVRIVSFARKYCSAKLFEPLTEAEQHQIDFIAGIKKWDLDALNVCHDAYARRMADSEKYLISGLRPGDAKVFTGYITLWTVVKLAFDAFLLIFNRSRKSAS